MRMFVHELEYPVEILNPTLMLPAIANEDIKK